MTNYYTDDGGLKSKEYYDRYKIYLETSGYYEMVVVWPKTAIPLPELWEKAWKEHKVMIVMEKGSPNPVYLSPYKILKITRC